MIFYKATDACVSQENGFVSSQTEWSIGKYLLCAPKTKLHLYMISKDFSNLLLEMVATNLSGLNTGLSERPSS